MSDDGMVLIETGETLVFLFAPTAPAVAVQVELLDFDETRESVELFYDNQEHASEDRRRQANSDVNDRRRQADGVVLLTQAKQNVEEETKLGFTRYRFVPSQNTTFSVSEFIVRLKKQNTMTTTASPSTIADDSSFLFGLSLLYFLLILGAIVLCCVLMIVCVVLVVMRNRDDEQENDTLSPDYSFSEPKLDEDYFGTHDDIDEDFDDTVVARNNDVYGNCCLKK